MISVNAAKLQDLIFSVLRAENVDSAVAGYVSEGLVQASLRGVRSHGVRLIFHYLAGLKAGRLNPQPKYTVERTSASTAILDADHTFGHAAGMEAAHLAMEIAQSSGTGQVAVINSSHFGAASYFALEIAAHDMIGMSFTHSESLIVPTGSKRKFLGNNPICFTAPIADEGPLCLDMATSIITFNEVRRLREINQPAPAGVGVDENAVETTDPHRISMLLPVGGYKGYGLSLMVEVLCSMLTGMPYGPHMTHMFGEDLSQKRRLGHFVSALRVDCFQPLDVFKRRMKELVNELRNEPPVNAEVSVMVAGDPEKKASVLSEKNGIALPVEQYDQFCSMEKHYGLVSILG